MPLTAKEVSTLIILERTSASVSVVSTIILLSTFCFVKGFRTLSNTLIFYASFANLFASLAALIGGSALHNTDGPLCQFQAFLLEMFMQSDPYWACAMAVNVYLVFFRRYDPVRLKRFHWIYILLCYGIPFIPAMFCLFYRDSRGKMYGNATLWCWIDNKYKWVRIYSYYLPIWIMIATTLAIYLRVGFEIYRVRAQIRNLENSSEYTSNNYNSGSHNSNTLTSQTLTSHTLSNATTNSNATNRNNSQTPSGVEVPKPAETETGLWRIDSNEGSEMNYHAYARQSRIGSQATQNDPEAGVGSHQSRTISRPTALQASLSSPLDPTYPLPIPEERTPSHSPQRTTMDKIKWAYTKCALLFAVSILITWVPASINRVQGLANQRSPSYALNVMTAIVLPLQGFWNTVIFFATSWSITKRTFRRWRKGRKGKGKGKGKNRCKKRDRRARKQEETEKTDRSRRGDKQADSEAVKAEDGTGGKKVVKEKEKEKEKAEDSSGRSSDRTLMEENV